MSRIGRNPVKIIEGATVTVEKNLVTVTGPQGTLTLNLPRNITVEVKDGIVYIARLSEDKKVKSCHGATRAHINNMVTGVTTPWKKDMEIRGTGYKFAVNGNKLIVTAGYINPVEVIFPQTIKMTVTEDTKLLITGPDKVLVGQFASNIRKIRKPEPYKGKGVRYTNEFIKLKAGKTAKA